MKFHRLTLSKRGHFSNYFTLFPVCALEFAKNELIIEQRGKIYVCPYTEISASILNTYTFKAYGAGTGARIKQRLVTIHSHDRDFRFDLSNQFPDFPNKNEILKLLSENISVNEINDSVKTYKNRQLWVSGSIIGALVLLWLVTSCYGI